MDDSPKPLFYSTLRWFILISVVISIGWLVFTFLYADTYAKNKEAQVMEQAKQKSRTRFREGSHAKTDPLAVLEPKKLASLIRTLSIGGIIVQCVFLYGLYKNNLYLSMTFIIWAFLVAIFAFKIAIKDHLFWIPAGWCLAVGLASSQYTHYLRQLK